MRLEEIISGRLRKRKELIAAGKDVYPSEARRTHTALELSDNFDQLKADSVPVVIAGRVMSIRRHGGLCFIDLQDGTAGIQLQLAKDQTLEDSYQALEWLDTGDFIQAAGKAMLTERAVQSILVSEWHWLSKSTRPLPDGWYGLKDKEARLRQREIDLLLNDEVKRTILMRSRVIQWLREYMIRQGYVEVESPVLQTVPGGAAARPFSTEHIALDAKLFLRISSELALKRLITGGMEKVFEIGKRFRNEGIDRQHNPEFTMLESQWAYADYEDLMDFTEEVMEKITKDLKGACEIVWQGKKLDFTKPLRRVKYADLLQEITGINVLEIKGKGAYLEIFKSHGLKVPEFDDYNHLVDGLYKELARPKIIQPTLLYDYPVEMVPLGKPSRQDIRVAEKFQLVAAGMELNNCYTEQTDPVEQRSRLEEQQKKRKRGNFEAEPLDEVYLNSLEYGMPPNAGWSMGIDRLVMLMADEPTLRDTIAFPLLRPKA